MLGELAVFAGTSGPSVIHCAASYLEHYEIERQEKYVSTAEDN